MHQSFDGTTATLQITATKTNHAATYKVVIANEFGSDDSEADLKVEGKLAFLGILRRFLVTI